MREAKHQHGREHGENESGVGARKPKTAEHQTTSITEQTKKQRQKREARKG
jgi:hypothetical protein